MKEPGFYIHTSYGLFPAPLPQDSPNTEKICDYFHFLGIFIAKALQDGRLVDLPISTSFLKLICSAGNGQKICNMVDQDNATNSDENCYNSLPTTLSLDDMLLQEREELAREARTKREKYEIQSKSWFFGVLDNKDLHLISPHHALFLQQLNELVVLKQKVLANNSLSWEDRQNQIRNLFIPMNQAQTSTHLDDLGLTFQYLPSSKVYGYSAVDLKPNGEYEEVTIDNVEEYIELVMDFCLHTGIKKQMEAFRGKQS